MFLTVNAFSAVTSGHALKRNTQLTDLGLADNFLDAKALTELSSALEYNSTLRCLNLSGAYRSPHATSDPATTSTSM